MIKQLHQFEHKIDDKVYHFYCELDAPLGAIHDALHSFKSIVLNQMLAEQQGPQPPHVEEVKDVVQNTTG